MQSQQYKKIKNKFSEILKNLSKQVWKS